MSEVPSVIRSYVPSQDFNFISNSWLEDYRRNSFFSHDIPNSIYYPNHTSVITKLIERSSVLLIVNPSDQNQIYGYIVFEFFLGDLIIHWIHVKDKFRKFHLATKLLSSITTPKETPIFASHMTKITKSLIKTYKITYNPYLIFLEH